MASFSDQIRDNIKRTRTANGITSEQMATHLNISLRAYAEFETGRTKLDLDRLDQIAQRFEMSLLDLLSVHERKTVYNNAYLIDREVYEQHIRDLRSEIEYLREKKHSHA